jgi:hypothetical protein
VKALLTFIVYALCATCCAQSWIPADRLGVGRIKSWDDIPSQTSSPQQILGMVATPVTSYSAPGASNAPFYERRMMPETSALKAYFEQMLAEKDERVLKTASLRLQIPNSTAWFREVFGPELGSTLDNEYSQLRSGWTRQFLPLLKGLRERGQTVVAVQVIRSPSDPEAIDAQRQALSNMQRPTSLYTARFINPATRDEYVMYSFAYVDGAFRFLGRMQQSPAPQAADAQSRASEPEVVLTPAPTVAAPAAHRW